MEFEHQTVHGKGARSKWPVNARLLFLVGLTAVSVFLHEHVRSTSHQLHRVKLKDSAPERSGEEQQDNKKVQMQTTGTGPLSRSFATSSTTDSKVINADIPAMPVCSTSTRLARLKSTCPPQSESMVDWLDSLSVYELKSLTRHWRVDENHKVLGCLHPKVSTTTWSAILCNNSRLLNKPLSSRARLFKKCLARSRIYYLGRNKALTKEDIVHRMKTYYKFMVVRHPLDRLVSAWSDKFEHPKTHDIIFLKKHGPSILLKYQPTGLTQKQIKAGKGVMFQEMIQYILDGHRDVHWDGPYSQTCQPCHINFDAVVKLETFDEDVAPIINDRLEGRSHRTVKNKHGKSSWSHQYEKILAQYKNVSDSQLKSTVKKYWDDFKPFGYDFQRMNDGAVKLTCSIDNNTGSCC